MRKFRNLEKVAGEAAIGRMSEKAQDFYSSSAPFDVYAGAWGEKDGMSFEELEKALEEFAAIC